MYEPAMHTIFCERWGLWASPDNLDDDQRIKVIAISIGLGCLFNDGPDAERRWMETPRDGTTPIAMVLAGKFDDVLAMVEDQRFPSNFT